MSDSSASDTASAHISRPYVGLSLFKSSHNDRCLISLYSSITAIWTFVLRPSQGLSIYHLIYISSVTPSAHPHDIPARDLLAMCQARTLNRHKTPQSIPRFYPPISLAALYAPICDGPPRLAMPSGVNESILGYVLLYASILELILGSQCRSHHRL